MEGSQQDRLCARTVWEKTWGEYDWGGTEPTRSKGVCGQLCCRQHRELRVPQSAAVKGLSMHEQERESAAPRGDRRCHAHLRDGGGGGPQTEELGRCKQ